MSMNELKKSTYIALVGVIVSAVALTTATYAWFLNNQQVETDPISFTSEATSDLMIAAHNGIANVGDQSGLQYKSFLSNEDVKEYLDLVDGLRGVSTVSAAAFYTNSGMTPDGDLGTVDDNGFDLSNKAEYFKTVQDNEGLYLALPIWFRSSIDADVYLRGGVTTTSGTAITAESLPGATKGEYLTRAIMVGFKPEGEAAVLYEPDGAEDGGEYARRNTTRFGDQVVADKQGIASLNGERKIERIAAQDRKSADDLFMKTDTLAKVTTEQIESLSPRPAPLFTIRGGVPKKVTIYLWLDGMDYDCISDISRGKLSVKLNFISGEIVL